MRQKQNQTGFTLVEMLVVVSIIGLLSSIILVSVGNSRDKAVDAVGLHNIKTLQTAMEAYKGDHGEMPVLTGANRYITSNDPEWTTVLGSALTPYLSSMPTVSPTNPIYYVGLDKVSWASICFTPVGLHLACASGNDGYLFATYEKDPVGDLGTRDNGLIIKVIDAYSGRWFAQWY